MRTSHTFRVGDARSLNGVDNGAIDLVVTSPPYPMIEMWDEQFSALSDKADGALNEGRSRDAYEAMHDGLDAAWEELQRVVSDGGIVCVNIGDATRSHDGSFELWPSHARITSWFAESDEFHVLPSILWRKPTNSAAKFMGSGMRPPNAYVTLEREHILIFRKGEGPRRGVEPERRDRSAYFYHERNEWFSDVWTDISGARQTIDNDARKRSGAYPFEIPYRLINMFSVQGDTVLDPFAGTGTTTAAAMASARSSVSVDIDAAFKDAAHERFLDVQSLTKQRNAARIDAARAAADGDYEYHSTLYDIPVRTSQEEKLTLYNISDIEHEEVGSYVVKHERYMPDKK